ncbi:crossover junction endodeoxyribonuclease RuvC [Candidatus Wolfebacteria bacterium]|nr:crossover junction endodeoxyribonuclease RuvC [Candidatus Wolfebacteria bacterium]
MLILGIDPGSTRVGYGLIKKQNNELKLITSGLLKILSKDKGLRLLEIETQFLKLLKTQKPDLVVLEKLFFMKNLKTAMEVAQSRGVLTLICVKHKISLLELAPSEIKSAVAGHGQADKKSISSMVSKILKVDEIKGPDDITDAIAAAIAGSNNFYLKINNIKLEL